ncbi:Nup93/Nic96-domain-containing protein [Tribonema minus]|uniref:Nup93/Nic96-domain-containing protein n=1 Tax=Tribonema minus TaxID=303371 RepID=A0A836CLK7_9STRA|nr:Nup93/Nic96-domain-containing protein [Tribonema minus]
MSLFAQRPLDGGVGSRPSTLPPSNTNGDLGAAAAMDLDNLLVQSSLLAAQIDRPEGIPLLNRSVFEIEEDATRMADAEQRAGVDESAGYRMLAQGGFDAQATGSDLDHVQAQAREERQEPLGDTDVRGYLEHQQHLIAMSAVDDAIQFVRRLQRTAAHAAMRRQRCKFKAAARSCLAAAARQHRPTQLQSEFNAAPRAALARSGCCQGAAQDAANRRMQAYEREAWRKIRAANGDAAPQLTGRATPLLASLRADRGRSGASLAGGGGVFAGGRSQLTRQVPSNCARKALLASLRADRGRGGGGGASLAGGGGVFAGGRSQLTRQMLVHAKAVRALNEADASGATLAALGGSAGERRFAVLKVFEAAAAELVPPNAVSGPSVAYRRLWELLRTMLEPTPADSAADKDEDRWRRGALRYLEEVYYAVLNDRVNKAVQRGELEMARAASDAGATSLRGRVEAAAELDELRGHVSGAAAAPKLAGRAPLWPAVYQCLRCGSPALAQEVVQSAMAADIPDASLSDVALALGAEAGDRGAADMETVRDNLRHEYEALKGAAAAHAQARNGGAVDPPPQPNPYKQLVLNLLLKEEAGRTLQLNHVTVQRCDGYFVLLHEFADEAMATGNDPVEKGLLTTVEDYMWFKLRFCVSHEVTAGREFTLKLLQQEVTVKYGAAHFDKGGHTPYLYASILAMCQLFGEAARYLRRAQEVVAAVHVTIALAAVKALTDDTATRPFDAKYLPEEDAVEDELQMARAGGEGGGKGGRLLKALVLAYTQCIQGSDPVVALHYLYRLRGRRAASNEPDDFQASAQNAQEQAARLLLETRAYSELAGELDDNGQRTGQGQLARLMNEEEVGAVLRLAGDMAQQQGLTLDAIQLYGMAGQFRAVLELFNQTVLQLYSLADQFRAVLEVFNQTLLQLLVPTDDNAERRRQEAERAGHFFNVHFGPRSGGSTYVLNQVLQQDPQRQQLAFFECLLKLVMFFDRVRAGTHSEALAILDETGLLPRSEVEVQERVARFHNLHPGLRARYPQILAGAMESLYQRYQDLAKRTRAIGEGGWATGGAPATHQLRDTKQRAQVLVTFTAMLGAAVPPQTLSHISGLEESMDRDATRKENHYIHDRRMEARHVDPHSLESPGGRKRPNLPQRHHKVAQPPAAEKRHGTGAHNWGSLEEVALGEADAQLEAEQEQETIAGEEGWEGQPGGAGEWAGGLEGGQGGGGANTEYTLASQQKRMVEIRAIALSQRLMRRVLLNAGAIDGGVIACQQPLSTAAASGCQARQRRRRSTGGATAPCDSGTMT